MIQAGDAPEQGQNQSDDQNENQGDENVSDGGENDYDWKETQLISNGDFETKDLTDWSAEIGT